MTSARSDRARTAILVEDAIRELLHVHRIEQARLLRVASHHRLRRAPDGAGALLPPPRSPREVSGCRTRAAWRAAALEEIRTARADGALVSPVLAALSRSPVEAWGRASSIAAAALELEACQPGRVALARALLSERRLGEAVRILLAVLEEHPLEDGRLETFEALATSFEIADDVEGSIAFRAAALASRGGDLAQAVPLLALALCAGDEPRAAAASSRLRRLDLDVPGVRARFDAALSDARRRLESLGPRSAPASSARGIRIRAFLARHRGPEAEVARVVLQGCRD